MKKIITLILFIIFVFSVNVNAAPFLVCDPPAAEMQVTEYDIYKDGLKIGTSPAQADGSLKYDLQGITPGQYTWTATAINVWGASELSDPYVSPALVGKPSGVGLER